MFNRSKYGKILKIVLFISIILLIGIIVITGYRMYNSYYIVTGAKAAAIQFEETVKNNRGEPNITTKYKEFTVIGTIRIPNINLKYPILQENNTEALETSVSLVYTSQGLNNKGNSVIIGHNYRNGILFSDLKELNESDYIYIIDTIGKEGKYKIYSIYETAKDDNSYITRNTNGETEITLSTITNDAKSKLIILARRDKEI